MNFRDITRNGKPFVIAEIGQNHQGDAKLAMDYIQKFAHAGADAVKFQTRDNRYLFDDLSYQKEYNSENAFGKTYGEHREALELDLSEVELLRNKCRELDIAFMSTPFDEPSLDFLLKIDTDILKVASFDLGNVAFLKRMAVSQKPIVLSVGGGRANHISSSVETILKYNSNLAVLHCVSEYPCPHDKLGLSNIPKLIDAFPQCVIGLSDHFNGTLSGPIGYMQGARVFEKHVTLNRAWKGTDHGFALEPRGFETFVRDINRAPQMLNSKDINEIGSELVFKKLGKSIAAISNMDAGTILTLDNLRGKIFAEPGVPVREMSSFIGRKLKHSISAGEKILSDDVI